MKVALPKDLEQDARLAKRSHAESCRQKRIFNARDRIIGGDTEAWDVQVHDQKMREATDKARHETFAAEMRHNDKLMCILEGRERRDRKNLCRAISDFQQRFQKPETRREFDLSDPLALKKDLPARLSDNDTRNTVSGMQKFMGEDLNFWERKKFQEEQNREWSLEQQREWERARADHKTAEDLHKQTRLQLDEAARHLQKLESASRKAACVAVKEFNKNQAAELAERKRQERKREQEDNLAEISALLQGDLLSENLQQAARSFGPHRVMPDHWKGMSPEQLQEIRLAQKQQVQEKLVPFPSPPSSEPPLSPVALCSPAPVFSLSQGHAHQGGCLKEFPFWWGEHVKGRSQEEERQCNMDWDQQRIQKARATLLEERQRQRQQRNLRRDLDSSNLSLAREQRLQCQSRVHLQCPYGVALRSQGVGFCQHSRWNWTLYCGDNMLEKIYGRSI